MDLIIKDKDETLVLPVYPSEEAEQFDGGDVMSEFECLKEWVKEYENHI